ncbi:hypothetical protein BS50DRAFT_648118 [Corynespora cassiicola Philippines]|uniref:Heterokaryon incompatibility domain-containing protein n=1 Tax=Corynespora cassiicola Philippines TaxID=1448308 RepID=A0A2T2NFI4_CORCC|nr:hypothetical protein BS50DRAFT_648118 [Corynespora cassiicola Philippines]
MAHALEIEPRRLIESIQARFNSAFSEELAQIVTDLLDLATSEIYDSSTHFIEELLQNADDNEYDENVLPTLAFTSEPGGLRVDCNERGFQAKHVQAISSVRCSTKPGSGHSQRLYTGEKGIGFKSVYRIADEVYISSQAYSFKFDKSQKFGILAPLWAEFPRPVIPNLTSFFLKLADNYDQKELNQDLRNFNPQLLLFLRRIKKVVLNVLDDKGYIFSRTIHKEITVEEGYTITTLENDGNKLQFATFEYLVTGLPLEPRRPDASISPLTFAFPITNFPDEPQITAEKVFSLLPIATYGLKFLLNGDFVLSTSRLDIDISVPWNQKLRDGVVDGFLESVSHFNLGHLKYLWPFYIPHSGLSAFFLPVRELILGRLRTSKVLESSANLMSDPASLVYVDPRKYSDSSGRPFTLSPATEKRYLSTKYPDWTIESILDLGVFKMSDKEFLIDLELMINSGTTVFQDQSIQWHEDLCTALLPVVKDPELKKLLRRLPIIQLFDDSWTSAARNPVFLPDYFNPTTFPNSSDISVVKYAFSESHNRRTLLQALGIVEIDRIRLCKYIADVHASKDFHPERFSRGELISHAAFLFTSSWQPPEWNPADLWFATSNGGRCKGSQLYLQRDFKTDSAMTRVFNKLRERFSTADDNYFLGPASADAMRLTDHLDCSFATYQRSRIVAMPSNSSFDARQLHDSTMTKNPTPQSFLNPEKAELVFDIDDDLILTDGQITNPILLTTPATSWSQCDFLLPMCRDIHEDYFGSSILGLLESRQMRKTEFLAQEPEVTQQRESETRISWQQYLVKNLHLSDIPRLVTRYKGTSTKKFMLSEEFKFLFNNCAVSDVLQILNENWTAYEEWLEFSHEKHSYDDAKLSHRILLEDIGNTQVRSCQSVWSLRDLILPDLDPYVEKLNIPLPVLETDYEINNTFKSRLTLFGISIINDVRYYLTCLRCVYRQGFVEHDALAYLYEQIEVQYADNETIVREVFEKEPLIYLTSSGKTMKSSSWLNIDQATKRKSDVISLYPGCKYIFNWLLRAPNEDIDSLIEAAVSINPFWPSVRILDLLTHLSSSLKNITPIRAKILVKILLDHAIFPIGEALHEKPCLKLVSSRDDSWFIADQSNLERSFRGVVPLLQFPINKVWSLDSLFISMDLGSRKLSTLCTRNVFTSGERQFSAHDTEFLRFRSTLFIQDLIPRLREDRSAIAAQLINSQVIVATEIFQRYMFSCKNGLDYLGKIQIAEMDIRVEPGRKELRIFVPRFGFLYQQRCFPLVDLIADFCHIVEPRDLRLLDAALSDDDINRVHQLYENSGYTGHGNQNNDTEVAISITRRCQKGDIFRIPSTILEETIESSSNDNAVETLPSGLQSVRTSSQSPITQSQTRESEQISRRLPFVRFSRVDIGLPENPIDAEGVFLVGQDMDPARHLEYYGQQLASQMLKQKLPDAYDPEVHWTSELRQGPSAPVFPNNSDTSPFTLADPNASKEMSKLLLRLGNVRVMHWQNEFPIYHIEIAVSGEPRSDSFMWSTSQLKRIQTYRRDRKDKARAEAMNKYRLGRRTDIRDDSTRKHRPGSKTPTRDHVMILLHISDAFSSPKFRIHLDPWELVTSDRLTIYSNSKFWAKIEYPGSTFMVSEPQNTITTTSSADQDSVRLDQSFSVIKPNQALYAYKTLANEEIRLFMLFPGSKHDPVRGMIFNAPSSESAGPYRTLSYEWGTGTDQHHIVTENGLLKIRGPLYKTLVHIRKQKNPIVLWIDAICINQNDEREKTQQIRLLPQIFKYSRCTLAFFGSDNQSDKALETLLQIRTKLDSAKEWPEGLNKVPKNWEKLSKPPLDDPIWQEIKCFFSRTWFLRAWIVQEAVTAPTITIVCGKWMIDWEDLWLALEVIKEEPHLPAEFSDSWMPFSTLSTLREYEARGLPQFSLLALLHTFSYLNSTLKRDRFYSLLGLAEDGDREDFEPAYGNVDFATIALQFGRAFVEQGHGVHLLHMAGIAGRQANALERFPSWLPDFTVKHNNRLVNLHARGMNSDAYKDSEASFDFLEARMLKTEGYIVDEIVRVSENANGQGPEQWVKYFEEIDSTVDALYNKKGSQYCQYLKRNVPVAGALSLGEITIEDSYAAFRHKLDNHESRSAKGFDGHQSNAILRTSDMSEGGTLTWLQKSMHYEELLQRDIAGWRFVVTRRKHCGIAPSGVKLGDLVSIIRGGDIPFVLRKDADVKGFPGSLNCRLVAGCYIHGIMNGEALALPDIHQTVFHFL